MKIIIGCLLLAMISGAGTYIYLYDVFSPPTSESLYSFSINDIEVDRFCFFLQYDAYSTQEEVINDLLDTPFDLFILDMYFDESVWTQDILNSLKFSNGETQNRLVFSYISIGEAESYRPYWNTTWDDDQDGIPDDSAPAWLDQENSNWKGNYKVKYWDPSWQSIIYGSNSSYLDQIINLGFDGAYLDIIDAFEYYEENGMENAANLMVDFVVNISTYAKMKKPHFIIVPQNGEYLGVFPRYLDAIDGIGREDVFFNGNARNSASSINETTSFLKNFQNNGHFVLNIEYPSFLRYIREAYEQGNSFSYVTYVAPRALDELWIWER